MKNLIQDDIIENINSNLAAGNITQADAYKMMRSTQKLYEHVYSRYEEMEELNRMTDESLMFDIDVVEKKYETALEKLEAALSEKNAALSEKDAALSEKDAALSEKDAALSEKNAELSEKDAALSEKDAEIARLNQQMAELQKRLSSR